MAREHLAQSAGAVSDGHAEAASETVQLLLAADSPVARTDVVRASGELLSTLLARLWHSGWQPEDLHQLVTARLAEQHRAALVAALTDEAQNYPWARIDSRWQRQLTVLGADPSGAVPMARDTAAIRSGADEARQSTAAAIVAAIELLALMLTLPPVAVLLPRPGTARPGPAGRPLSQADDRQLARVRALLAKAESSAFPEEAEALSAKAQELMSRHSLERRLVESVEHELPPVIGRRLWLSAPYAVAKAMLVDSVAVANRCGAVWSEQLGFVCVLGTERDVAAVELLVTSLLVQASRAMIVGAAAGAAQRQRRTRSFRQSFLVAYASRIGERLTGSAEQAQQALDEPSLLPVLRADAQRVDDERRRLFPQLTSKHVPVNNAAGWAAGIAAADLALLDSNVQVETGARRAG